ncbi:thioredoxin TrxC [Maridesulfovibrio ferrireducens]|uniref:thioredoxin TrxC n=1 Tax=Maridesulfovibrio ferrireducens TaxID=246191 RepID=UPI001A267936|nr:thioredoxin TrxC [Maridesulfovibrio ferrireducens]MBI9112720.1 thioredoxin TrxC [Maridesulfovibrio ferrireducens]
MDDTTSGAIHVVCPNCRAVNRILSKRFGDQPACGKCGGQVLIPKPVELTASTFDRFISKTDLPVLVDFWAPWCGHCKSMAPAFQSAAAEIFPKILTAKVETEHSKELSAKFNIRSLPTLVLFNNGREQKRISGAMTTQQIVEWVKQSS